MLERFNQCSISIVNPSNEISLLSANCRGLNNKKKRYDVLTYIKEMKINIACLQDTHLVESMENVLKNYWDGKVFLNCRRSNARGVAILLSNNFEYKVIKTEKDTEGNLLVMDLAIEDTKFRIINVYGPNMDDVDFYHNVKYKIHENEQDHLLLFGDLNLTLNPNLDSHNYSNLNNPRARSSMINIIEEYGLIDLYRYLNPNKTRYTWRRRNPLKQARLDYILMSDTTVDFVDVMDIKPSYKSDHSSLYLRLNLTKFNNGKGIWKFNTRYLSDPEYLLKINDAIRDEYIKYAVPVYNVTYITVDAFPEIALTINSEKFLEAMLLRLRGETIKYASKAKRKECNKENLLISEIEVLESNPVDIQSPVLEMKKTELEEIRSERLKGQWVRSRTQWNIEGEKPTKYFCSLETKNYLSKTIKRLKQSNGSFLTNQKEILDSIAHYYQTLFKSKDQNLSEYCLSDMLGQYSINKLDINEASTLEGALTEIELGKALKNMKHNKTPGIDGFPSEFYKVFWKRLKFCVLNALNDSLARGRLPLSLRQCVITCLPKKGKDRDMIKNWRPLSMLSVLYKLASAAIANRLKPYLDHLISKTQNGFVPGRYIGECTRLIYDTMSFAEKNNVPGMLILIDFEKAFDSVSWTFIYQTLEFLGFGESFINWIKLFNTDVKATIIQCGFLSKFIDIERGCRQGDPISSYLFILAAQILTILFLNNPNIKGIFCGSTEIKLSQFADDTILILDGTPQSLQAAFNVLEIFGSVSGLRVNTEKTQVVWIGKKKLCNEKLLKLNLKWDTTHFNMLGLSFSVDLLECTEINFSNQIVEIQKIINNWNKRHLTPIGKITVIKTFILSKLNHLLLSLPNPNLLSKINSILYSFLWSNKPDKIKRDVVRLPPLAGGLKMIDIDLFMKSMKITWIRRLFISSNAPCVNLLLADTSICLNKLSNFGPQYLSMLKSKLNPFWQDVFECWKTMLTNSQIQNIEDILKAPLWYNPLISDRPLYFPDWFYKGVITVSDVISNNKIAGYDELCQMFSCHFNYLNYLTLKFKINIFLIKYGFTFENITLERPFVSFNLRSTLKDKKGVRSIYSVFLVNLQNNHSMKLRWNEEFQTQIDNNTWKTLFSICFKTVANNNLIWFQLKLIYRILGTNNYLFKLGIKNNPNCLFCHQPESLLHIFYHCPNSIQLWEDIEKLLEERIRLSIKFSCFNVVFGYINKDQNHIPINSLILITKKYIFDASRDGKRLILRSLQHRLNRLFRDEEHRAHLYGKELIFSRVWDRWASVFCLSI